MLSRALLLFAASLAVCSPLVAETPVTDAAESARFELKQARPSEMVTGRPALGETGSFRVLINSWYGNGPLTLLDRRLFSFPGAFGWVEASDETFLPAFSAQEVPRDLFRKPDYVGGEVGVFYGTSLGGKFSREVEQGYILGEIVDGNTRIQVGASYGRSSGNGPRIIGR